MTDLSSSINRQSIDRRLCVAPMMDWTDRHCRYFHRLLAPKALLYTEMVTTGAVLYGDRARFLDFNDVEHPVAIQLGGSCPGELAQVAKICESWGYDEINLNVGCPSDRVQKGRFGACLMKEPKLVADCLSAMIESVEIPVTMKCRIGVDEMDSDQAFIDFIGHTAVPGLETVIVHARKAWLSGLSPKENREVPVLDYPRVQCMAQAFPSLEVILNGGLTTVEGAMEQLSAFDGVMLGRSAYQTPWILTELSHALGEEAPTSRRWVVEQMMDYTTQHVKAGGRVHQVARHMLGLFHGQPGARGWRQRLSQTMHRPNAKPQLLMDACPEAGCVNALLEDIDWPFSPGLDGTLDG